MNGQKTRRVDADQGRAREVEVDVLVLRQMHKKGKGLRNEATRHGVVTGRLGLVALKLKLKGAPSWPFTHGCGAHLTTQLECHLGTG